MQDWEGKYVYKFLQPLQLHLLEGYTLLHKLALLLLLDPTFTIFTLTATAGLGVITVIVDVDALVCFLALACFGAACAAVDLFVTGVMA